MTLTALCEVILDKSHCITIHELEPNGDVEVMVDTLPAFVLEYGAYALYAVRYVDFTEHSTVVYVTKPNDGYKKADF